VIGTILSCTLSGNEFFGASTFIVILLYVSFHFILFLFNVSRASSNSSFISTGDIASSIVDHKLIDLKTAGDIVPASISKFSISSINSSTFSHVITVHVFTSHVVTSGVEVSSDEDEFHHDDFFFHCATNSAHHNGIVSGKSGSHPINLYHALVGLVGAVRFDSYFHVIGSTSLPLFASNVIV
jgi:hypothetical protein